MDEVDTPTVHPLAEEEMFEVMDTEDHLDSDTEYLADETTEVVLTEAEVEEIKKFMLEYIDQREAELLAGNESHEDADVEVEAEDINTLTDTQLDDTKATFSQTLAEIEILKKDTPEIDTRKNQEKKKTRRGTRGKGRKIHYKKKGEQVMSSMKTLNAAAVMRLFIILVLAVHMAPGVRSGNKASEAPTPNNEVNNQRTAVEVVLFFTVTQSEGTLHTDFRDFMLL
ncbi:hypothetical protein AOLI_G00317070 [Acnodon oligacanthus]